MHSVCYLVFTRVSAPFHSFTFSHITHPFSCKSCIQCSLPLHSLAHSSIMHTLCLMHTHFSFYTCCLQHAYRLRHVHCSMHASQFMDAFHLMCTCRSINIPPFIDTGHFIHTSSVYTVSFKNCTGLLLGLLALCTLILDAHVLHIATLPVYHTCHLLHTCSKLL